MKGILYTSYFAKLNKGIGIKVSVARYNPKWLDFEKYNIKKAIGLAPSIDLLKDYKNNNMEWNDYVKRYIKEGFSNENFKSNIQKIRHLLDHGADVTIYCYEKSTDNCHRHIIANIFKKHRYQSKEIL